MSGQYEAEPSVVVRARISAAIDNEYANRAPDLLPLDKLDMGVCAVEVDRLREEFASC